MKNEIIKALESIANSDIISSEDTCGFVKEPGTDSVTISEDIGTIYGFAVRLDKSEVEDFFNKYNQQNYITEYTEWKSIGNNFYPLYWGEAKEGVARVDSHLKAHTGKGSIQLNIRTELKNKEVIYGLIQVKNRLVNEDNIRKEYPDIYKNYKVKK